MNYFKYILVFATFILSCNGPNNKKEKTGEALAKVYCASCHLFPEPVLLDKKTWKDNIMPAMARQLGIDHIFETALPNQKQLVTVKEWKAILEYYISTSPDEMPPQNRPSVTRISHLFKSKIVTARNEELPSTSFIKIDAGNHWIWAANAADSSIDVYNSELKRISHNKMNAAIVDINYNSPLSKAGERNGIFTNIGIMNPNDQQSGAVNSFGFSDNGRLIYQAKLFDSLTRPVQVTKYDLDGDGKPDYLICGFGNTMGSLYWMKSNSSGGFDKNILKALPGAVKSYIEDLNHDGLPDIIVLMAQAREGIIIFFNQGAGKFETKEVLGFPPVYGSSYFELVDFNKDGYKDILYTCGDNDDYSSGAQKYYHGVYIFLNDGKNNFTQKYFFPIHGCYKAMAADFDKDGDPDIAAISFFPDKKNQPQESFVYLEQTTAFHFEPFMIDDFDAGKWITMDIGDLDGDGYKDIVLGSLIQPTTAKINEWKVSNRQKASILLLHNQGKR